MQIRLLGVLSLVGLMASALVAAEKADPNVPTPEAKALIEQVNSAYDKVGTLKVAGTLQADLDVAGNKQDRSVAFAGEFRSPNHYRHTIKDELVAGSTGEKVYLHELKQNLYATSDAPKEPTSYRKFPGVVGPLLEMQDPTLLLATSAKRVDDLIDGAKSVRVSEEPLQEQGKTLSTLAFTASDGRQIELGFDPSTKLLRKATYDLSEMMRNRGAQQINKAIITILYSDVQAGAEFAGDYFAWAPPADARDLTAAAGPSINASTSTAETASFVGKPAPEFTLQSLDGKDVALSSLKGKPVLLDFWATWCPPCIKALPEVNEIYDQKKDTVQVFAVNVGEDKATVEKFLKSKKLGLPVLLDEDEATMKLYKIRGIPTTVIITPSGIVHKVYVGFPPGGKEELIRELEAAAKL